MSNEDSASEDDSSFFDVYSSENVISRYRAVLNKLKSSSSENNVILCDSDGGKKATDEVKTDRSSCEEVFTQDSPEIIELNDSPNPASVAEESSSVRRSTRLKNKTRSKNLRTESTKIVGRKKRANKRNQNDTSIEIIDDNGKDFNNVNPSIDDAVNYEVSVKVIWKSVSVRNFNLRRFQKFTKIFEHFMNEENVSMDKILFTLNNKKIQPNDTPETVKLKACDFIEGGVLSNSIISASKEKMINSPNEKDSIVVKVQDAARNIFKFSLNKNESLKSVMIRYAEQTEFPLNKIRFYFDGELLNLSESPNSLGLDDNEIIDVKVIQ